MAETRTKVGWIALVLLVSAGVLWFVTYEVSALLAALARIGMVMAAFWLALPDMRVSRTRMVIGAVAITVVAAVALNPKMVKPLVPIAVVAAILIVLKRRSRPRG